MAASEEIGERMPGTMIGPGPVATAFRARASAPRYRRAPRPPLAARAREEGARARATGTRSGGDRAGPRRGGVVDADRGGFVSQPRGARRATAARAHAIGAADHRKRAESRG